jgi:perosamine synthetase
MFSILVIIFFLPLIILISLMILLIDGFPIIFIQKRVGKNNKIFKIFKFRTLNNKGKEINYIGNFLRKTKLDEILNFFNVLLNDMSLVGPRPLKEDYLNSYSKIQIKRHLIKPGIFGLTQMQVKDITWKKYFQMDLYYVKYHTFSLDVYIIFNCIINILLCKLRYKPLDNDKRFNS